MKQTLALSLVALLALSGGVAWSQQVYNGQRGAGGPYPCPRNNICTDNGSVDSGTTLPGGVGYYYPTYEKTPLGDAMRVCDSHTFYSPRVGTSAKGPVILKEQYSKGFEQCAEIERRYKVIDEAEKAASKRQRSYGPSVSVRTDL